MHPSTRIIAWIFFAWMAFSAGKPVLLALSVVFLPAFFLPESRFFRLVSRSRWILFSILLLYGFSGSGEKIFPYGPASEGLIDGSVQAWRLLLSIAALSVLLHCTSREMFLSGLYALLKPFALAGVDVKRIAIRLWLTLHYAEIAREGSLNERIRKAFEPEIFPAVKLTLDVYPFGWKDRAFFLLLFGLALL